MRDVSASLIPAGSEVITMHQHRGFIHDMAAMHAAYWGFRDDTGLCPLSHRYVFLTPTMAELEMATPRGDSVPPAVADGWRQLDEQYPADARRLRKLAADPWPLVDALHAGPQTFIHSDWKLGNLGREESRTILLDWDRTGEAPPLVDLAWYLAVNCDRLPESKEDTIDAYRTSLESSGIDTASWWDDQLSPALAGAFLQLAWSKTGDPAEFGWWSERLAAWNP
jgi:thiamine kinase-like enzyme